MLHKIIMATFFNKKRNSKAQHQEQKQYQNNTGKQQQQNQLANYKRPSSNANLLYDEYHHQHHTYRPSQPPGAPTTTYSKPNSSESFGSRRSLNKQRTNINSTPLSAQKASYEAMRTIDMYLIRQIARNCLNFEMEQKINLEIRLRELAAQSMLEAQNEIDILEVEKSLLASDKRMSCYASQLELQRKQLSNPSISTNNDSGHESLTKSRASNSSSSIGPNSASSKRKAPRSDVIGADGSSPASWSDCAQSPSKLSPVSGQSDTTTDTSSSTHNNNNGVSRNQSRQGFRHQQPGGSYGANTLKRAKNKQREQLMQSITSMSNINCNMCTTQRACVSVSEIRIPLLWRDVDHFKGQGDYKRYAIFCLFKIDSQIFDTQLISDVDRQVTDVTFDDIVVFNEIEHNFELTLEIYSCVYLEQFSLSSTPRKLKEKFTNSVSRAMGRKLLTTQMASTNFTKELDAYDKSYRFSMIASAKLTLNDASNDVKTYDLVLVSPNAHYKHHQTAHNNDYNSIYNNLSNHHHNSNHSTDKNILPLFGHFCCKLFIRPDVYDKHIKSGYLKVAQINVPTEPSNGCDRQQTLDRHNISPSSSSNSPMRSPASASEFSASRSQSESKFRSAVAASNKMATLSMSSSKLYWGFLRNFILYLWPVDEHRLQYALARGEMPQVDLQRKPAIIMNVDKYTQLLRVSNSSLTIGTETHCLVMGATCFSQEGHSQTDELGQWLRVIEQMIYDSHIWATALNHYPPHARRSSSMIQA